MQHTRQQQEAIEVIDHNLQIIACAGSGKTRVISSRVLRILQLLGASGITPANIVVFTFTEKAAATLKQRITGLYQAEFGHTQGLAAMYVGTIHGFCLDLLHRYVPKYLKFDVVDGIRQRLLVDRYYRRSGMALLELRRWVESDLYLTVLSVLRGSEADLRLLENHPVRAALDCYRELLDSRGYFDYDEMLLRAVEELRRNPAVRDQVGQRLRFLLVDEYQDVNPVQEALIREIHDLGANVCVCGDDDQNLYQWRGSDTRHILHFAQRYPNVVQTTLAENFRSSRAIVSVARQAVEVNRERLPKAMESRGRHPFDRGDLLCLRFDGPEAEAEWIAEKIFAMRGVPFQEEDRTRGLSWSDCAVLLRSVRHCAAPIVQALRARDIPHVVTGMTGLFDTPEVRAAVGLFQFLTGEIDEQTLRCLWHDADLGLADADLGQGATLLRERQNLDPNRVSRLANTQRVYLDFLEAVSLREERIPGGRGEVVLYNLGKFSQVIADYEEVHFRTPPSEKYAQFVQFLRYQAPGYYPEGGQDAAYATPDAVRIMTVHQAKGMEFPVVFLPCLQRNRFPARRQANRVWQHLPREAIQNADRYTTSEEDERRLFYVALTRSEKYLFASWAPMATNQLYRQPSPFLLELTRREECLTRDPGLAVDERLPPEPRRPSVNVELTFSDLKYLFECPYQFKLRLLYGFNPPIDEALGYGRSLHNALTEIHRRALAGEQVAEEAVPALLEEHLHVRYAYPELEETLRRGADRALRVYLREQGPHLHRLEHVEEVVQVTLPGGTVVHGRIDLIKRADTNEVIVVDFKSSVRAQAEEVTQLQLHVYALGYEQRFGSRADLIEVHNLDEGASLRERVDDSLMGQTVAAVTEAGRMLRENRLPRLTAWCSKCERCDMAGICRARPAVEA
jgi:DNA helicase-2/ATP-dependent DNA helicase PcrA